MSNTVRGDAGAGNLTMWNLFIVLEQQSLVRDALVALLAMGRPPGSVQGASSLAHCMPLLAGNPAAIVLADATIDGAIMALRARYPAVRVVAMAAVETRDGVLRCLAAGAHGYVAKSAPAAALLQAVRAVEAGQVPVAASPAAQAERTGPPAGELTGRQRDVLLLLAEGRSTKEIARTLDLAVSTIKVHLAAVYRAVGARNRVEALSRMGLLPRPERGADHRRTQSFPTAVNVILPDCRVDATA